MHIFPNLLNKIHELDANLRFIESVSLTVWPVDQRVTHMSSCAAEQALHTELITGYVNWLGFLLCVCLVPPRGETT